MAESKLLELFRSAPGVVKPAYSGYVIWTIVFLVIISVLSIASGSASIFSVMQAVLIYSAMALSYDYFAGFSGYYNLGFGAFIAVGAYFFVFTSNALVTVFPSNAVTAVFVSLLFAGFVSALFAAGISYPFLRLRGAYFAIATLALIFLLATIVTNLANYTGGMNGVHVIVAGPDSVVPVFIGSLLFLIITIFVHNTIGKSRLGLALKSIREDEEVTESFGVNAFRIKQIAMTLSGFFGAICGGLFAINLTNINTQAVLDPGLALFPVVAAIAGGMGLFLGPVVGSFVLISVNQFFSTNTALLNPLAVVGVLLIIVGLFAPGGILRLKSFQKYGYRQPDRSILKFFKKPPPATPVKAVPIKKPKTA